MVVVERDQSPAVCRACEAVWRLVRAQRPSGGQIVERMRFGSPAYDEAAVTVALGVLSRLGVAWPGEDGRWDARGLRILFVDDDAMRRAQFAAAAAGHEVVYAADSAAAAAALEAAGPEGFDVVYIDPVRLAPAPADAYAASWLASRPGFAILPAIVHSRDPRAGADAVLTLQASGFLVGFFSFAWQWPPLTCLTWLREFEPVEVAP